MIDFGIITAPRKKETLKKSVQYLRASGFDNEITLFKEPDCKDTVINNTYSIQHQTKQGCFGNFSFALSYLVENTKEKYVCVLSDDFEYSRNTKRIIERYLYSTEGFGYIALYTPWGMQRLTPNRGLNKVNLGWGNAWGGNYIFETKTARDIIKHPTFLDHLENYKKNQQIDHLIPKVCHELGLDQLYLNPSLCDHIGFDSTIGHEHTMREKGLNFAR